MKKRTRYLLLALAAALALIAPLGAIAEILPVEVAKKSVVRFYVEFTDSYGTPVSACTGSGFVINNDGNGQYVVTNRHVVTDGSLTPHPFIIYDDINSAIPAEIVAVNPQRDMAVVRTGKPIPGKEPIPLRSFSSKSMVGETVYSIGFPGASDAIMSATAQDMLISTEEMMSWSEGKAIRVIDSKDTNQQAGAGQVIQTNATINGGNSGGPLVDKAGYVVGICSFGAIEGENTFYAITANELTAYLDSIKVSYQKADGLMGSLLYLIGAGAFVLVAVFVVISKLSGKKSKQDPKPAPNPAPQPVSGPVRVLECTAGPLAGQIFNIRGKETVGRDAARCSIVFPKETKGVSGLHLSVTFDGSAVYVCDENSSFGTMLDDKRLPAGTPVKMHRGQTLYLGSYNVAMMLKGHSGR